MSNFILIALFQAIFFSVLLVSKNKKQPADLLLALYFLIFGLILANIYHLLEELYLKVPHFLEIGKTLVLLIGPVLFIYTMKVMGNRITVPVLLLHLSPFLILNLVNIPFYLLSAEEKINFYYGNNMVTLQGNPAFETTTGITKAVQLLSYSIVVVLLVARHRKSTGNIYSTLEKRTLTWIYIAAIGSLIVIFSSVGMYSRIEAGEPHSMYVEYPVFILLCVYILVIGFFGYRQIPLNVYPVEPSAGAQGNDESEIKYKRSGLTTEKAESILRKLHEQADTQKLFLQQDLNIHDLSLKTGIPVHHITEVLNQNLRKNFYDFINAFRVEEAKKLLVRKDRLHYTLEMIGYEAGFNSRSSFYTYFKKSTGYTPLEFQKKKSEQD